MSVEAVTIIIPLLMLLVLILLLSEYFRTKRRRLLEEGVLTEGEIVSVSTSPGRPERQVGNRTEKAREAKHYYKVAYLDQHGVRHHIHFHDKGRQKHQRYERLPVRYLPTTPADGALARPGDLMVPIYLCYFSALMVAVFLGFIVFVALQR